MVIFFQLGHYIAIITSLEGIITMSGNQEDWKTARNMVWTFIAFIVLGIILIIGANIIG